MGYSIDIIHTNKDRKDIPVLVTIPPEKQISSDICISDGEMTAQLTVTYNYSEYLYEAFGEKGIRSIYNKKLIDAYNDIDKAIKYLIDTYYPNRKYRNSKDNTNYNINELDYWKSCPFNVVRQLQYIKTLIDLVLKQKDTDDCIIVGD